MVEAHMHRSPTSGREALRNAQLVVSAHVLLDTMASMTAAVAAWLPRAKQALEGENPESFPQKFKDALVEATHCESTGAVIGHVIAPVLRAQNVCWADFDASVTACRRSVEDNDGWVLPTCELDTQALRVVEARVTQLASLEAIMMDVTGISALEARFVKPQWMVRILQTQATLFRGWLLKWTSEHRHLTRSAFTEQLNTACAHVQTEAGSMAQAVLAAGGVTLADFNGTLHFNLTRFVSDDSAMAPFAGEQASDLVRSAYARQRVLFATDLERALAEHHSTCPSHELATNELSPTAHAAMNATAPPLLHR